MSSRSRGVQFLSKSRGLKKVPNIAPTWGGENKTLSEQRGFRTWEKKVEIIEQKGRRFKGTFSYTDGTKNFFGVIHPDNLTITWVASNSRGSVSYTHLTLPTNREV